MMVYKTENFYKRVLWYGMAFLAVFTPIAVGGMRIWSITPVLLAELAVIFIWLWKTNNSDGHRFKKTAIDIPIFILLILAAISFVFAKYRHDSFFTLLRLFGYIGIYYVIVNEFDHAIRKGILNVVISVAASLSLFGILQYMGILGHSWWNPKEFLAATYVNHNHFAGYIELVIPTTISIIMGFRTASTRREANDAWRRIGLPIALVVMISAFIIAQSRGAWFSLSISLFMMFAISGKKYLGSKKNLLILILIISAIMVFAYFARDMISERLETVTMPKTSDMSFGMRLAIWRGAADMIKNNILIGTGIGTFDYAFNRYRPRKLNSIRAEFAHNEYLHIASEMGVLAVFIMIWIFGTVVIKGLKSGNPYALGCSAGILSLALHGLVDFNFHIPANMILFSVWCGIIMSEKD